MIFRNFRIALTIVGTLAAASAAAAAEPTDADLVEQGRYVALAGDCMPCHTNSKTQEFAGGLPINSETSL